MRLREEKRYEKGVSILHLAYKDRVLIEKMLGDGVCFRGIGILLNKHRNTVSLEISRSGMTRSNVSTLRKEKRECTM